MQPLSLGAAGLQSWGVQGWEASVLQALMACHLGSSPRGLDLVDLLGVGCFVHNQKLFVTESSPSQGAPASVHTPRLPLFQGLFVHSPRNPISPTTSW